MQSAVLDSLVHFVMQTQQNIHHLTIIRNNERVLSTDFYPYHARDLHDVASVTKSITSLLIGIAIDKGFIKSEEENVLSFFPGTKKQDTMLQAMTVKDLVTMTSGFDCRVEGGEKELQAMRLQDDWVKFMLDLPVTSVPGKKFSYCSGNYYLLGEIISRASGMDPYAFARKFLFGPLGITRSMWLSNHKGIAHGWGDLFLLPDDMVKIGQMVLGKGKWGNTQVVSSVWIKKSLTTYSHLADGKGYGYGWWTNDKGGYYEAAGRGRQTISVIPSKNILVVMVGGEFDAGTIGSYIFRSIGFNKKLPDNGKAYANLQKSLSIASLPPHQSDTTSTEIITHNDSVVSSLNERTIGLEKNITGIDSIRINIIKRDSGKVIFYRENKMASHPFVLSKTRYAISEDPDLQLPVALKAAVEGKEFVLHYNQLCRVNNFFFHFSIVNGKVSTRMVETSNGIDINIRSSLR